MNYLLKSKKEVKDILLRLINFNKMNWEGWTTLFLLLGMFGTLCSNKFNSGMVMFGFMNIFWLLGIITDKNVYQSFANNTIMTIGGLYIITKTISNTGIIHRVCYKIFGSSNSPKVALLRILVFNNLVSGFINNTPLVAILSPIIADWTRTKKISRSKFLIPLSYSSITGGCMTIIGTSTNLLVNQLLKSNGFEGIGFFDIALINIVPATISIIYLITVGFWLLPDNKGGLLELVETSSSENIDENQIGGKNYILKFIYDDEKVQTIQQLLDLINSNIKEEIHHIKLNSITKIYRKKNKRLENINIDINEEVSRVYLTDGEMENKDYVDLDINNFKVFSKIQPSFILRKQDEIIMSINLDKVSSLIKVQNDLSSFRLENLEKDELVLKDIHFFEVVVSPVCRVLESKGNFETIKRLWKRTYDADFIALKHKGNLNEKRKGINKDENPSDLSKLEVGDVVLIMADQIFYEKYKNSKDFYNISEIGKVPHELAWKDYIPSILFLIFIVLNTVQIASTSFLVQFFLFILVLGKYVNYKNFFRMVDLQIIFLMATSIAIANSMQNSGLAEDIGILLKKVNMSFFPTIILLYWVSLIITEFVTNNAAAAIMVPIIIAIHQNQGYNLNAMSFAVMIASSCGFSIPFGYATHLIVYGPGGYSIKDFLKVGIPLDYLYLITSCLMIYAFYG